MKRSAFLLALMLLAMVGAFAQNSKKTSPSALDDNPAATATPSRASNQSQIPLSSTSLRLENDSDRLVFFAIFPLKGGEMSALAAQPKQLLDRLRSWRDKLDYLAPQTVAPAIGVSDAEQLIVGFSVEAGTDSYPVWYASLPPKAKRVGPNLFQLSAVKFAADAQGMPVALRPIDFDLPQVPIRIDGRFVDWLKFNDQIGFPEASLPQRIIRSGDSGSQTIPVDQSLSFRRGGTDVEHVKLVRTGSDLMAMVSSHSVMSRGLSYLFRLYANDQETTNRFTLEIPVDGNGGPVLLWTSGKKDPQIIGNYATADYYVEARFSLKSLPAGLSKLFAGDWLVELSSAYTDADFSEEYFWGRFPASVIPKTD